jgi:hypothetical protein
MRRIRGVEMAWVEVDTLRFPGVPLGTSVRGIVFGEGAEIQEDELP